MTDKQNHLSQPEYDVIVAKNVIIPLRDGINLATDIYFPARHGKQIEAPCPVLLTRTPYDKNGLEKHGMYYARRGYIAAMQDVRGRYASEGTFYAFKNEAPDGYDTVEWLAAQPWSTGRIGTLGESYTAAVQNTLACMNPPHLAAMIPAYGPWSYYHCSMRHNGALELRFFTYAFTMASTSKEAMADPAIKRAMDDACANIWDWVDQFPIRRGCSPLQLIPSYEEWAIDISTHACYDDYWKAMGYGPLPYVAQHADVPTLYIGGWYDTYPRGTAENFMAFSAKQSAPVHLLLGPWEHGSRDRDAIVGDAFFPHLPGRLNYDEIHLRWFDQWLKGRDMGLDKAPSVEYFVMGGGKEPPDKEGRIQPGGEWRSCDGWPPPNTEAAPFYFHSDGTLSTSAPTTDDEPTRYLFDPDNPVPTIGGSLSAIPIPAGAFDQRNDPRFPNSHGTLPLSARPDVLCFQTAPLDGPLEIVGPVSVTLWVATDGPDTDFTAKLIDVYAVSTACPKGWAMNLTDSIARLRFRNGYETETLAEPGTIYELSFELYPTGNHFEKGHRIRIDISSSNYPRFDVNPNTGGPIGVERRHRIAENRLYHDREHPSHVILPVVQV